MIESPFGSVSPAWSGIPLTTGWPVTSSPIQNRVPGPGFATQPMPLSMPMQSPSPQPPGTGFGQGFGLPILSSPYGYAAAYPGMFPAVPTISALLMSVALRRGQPAGPVTDQEIEDFVYDVLEMLPGTSEVEVRCENGKVTLTGSVPHKRPKHDIGEIVRSIPNVTDVQNNIAISTKRRARAGREQEPQAAAGAAQSRKQP